VNGIESGYKGEGSKTIIPPVARAKLTCRLAPGQEPQHVTQAIATHVHRHPPPNVTVDIEWHPGAVRAFSIEQEHPAMQAAADALATVYGRAPLAIRLGSTLPVAAVVEDTIGSKTVMLGWSMSDENLHAPDEFSRLENLDRGARAYAELFNMFSSFVVAK
jgi:acetylornithine deacetylase/succinyl-diaminopimelate desuccinylase-like protein